MSSKEMFLTPKAEALYPFVTKPSTKFDKDGKYKITLLLDPTSTDHLALRKQIRGHLEAAKVELKAAKLNEPWKENVRKEDGTKTGLFEVTFKSDFPPRVFDSVGNKVTGDLNIGNKSIVKVAYKWAPYKGFGGGVALYLHAVQIIELVEYAGGEASDYGFAPEEGAFNVEARFAEAAAGDEPPVTDDQAQSAPDDDGSIPF